VIHPDCPTKGLISDNNITIDGKVFHDTSRYMSETFRLVIGQSFFDSFQDIALSQIEELLENFMMPHLPNIILTVIDDDLIKFNFTFE
jgi:hypothetical protein